MASIQIKNIGPLKDTGVLDFSTVNLLIGKQSTGKSTLLKILSFCHWIEKAVISGKKIKGQTAKYAYSHYYRFSQELMQFHRLPEFFFSPDSEIHYNGTAISIDFKGRHRNNARIEDKGSANCGNVKVSFIPSERNLVSAIQNVETDYKQRVYDMMLNFVREWDEMRQTYTIDRPLHLTVVPDMEYFYDPSKGDLIRQNGIKEPFSPFYASSGVQSSLPLEVIVKGVTDKVGTTVNVSTIDINELLNSIAEGTENALSGLKAKKLRYESSALFIEEIEQNLFPDAQSALLRETVAQVKRAQDKMPGCHNILAMTSHSPYILSELNVLMAASEAAETDSEATAKTVPQECILPKNSFRAYLVTDDGYVRNIIDNEIYMINGNDLDALSGYVEDRLDTLNEIIYSHE